MKQNNRHNIFTRMMMLYILIAAATAPKHCTFIADTDYYVSGQGPSGTATNASDCCTRVCAASTPFYVFASGGTCYCKSSDAHPTYSPGNTAGKCGAAPPPPPPQKFPNYQGCMDNVSSKLAYCDARKSFDERVAALVSSLNVTEKSRRMYSCVDNCDTCPCGVPRIGLPPYAYLVEVNTAVAAVCLSTASTSSPRCATVFSGPLGIAATFNRTVWRQKGDVISTEMRAFSNHGGKRGLGKRTGLMGFGPNINLVRDPRFGRTSELPGEDPFLNGQYAAEFTLGMQTPDANGYPRMIAYLKHFTAYSRETNRGHDTYNISKYDFADSYLPQFERGMNAGNSSGVMCSYNGENGFPSCANGWLLNTMLREKWNNPDAVVVTDSGAVRNLKGPPINCSGDPLSAAMALNNGSDMNDGTQYAFLPEAIASGLTTEATLDAALTRNMKQFFKVGLFDDPKNVEWTKITADAINSTEHQRINIEAAEQAVVLLRNEDNVLPLKGGALKIAVIGPQATAKAGLLSDYATEQPCAPSLYADPHACIVSIGEAVTAANGGNPKNTLVASGVDVNSVNMKGIAAALALAKEADVVLLCLGIDKSIEGEGTDRTELVLPGVQPLFAKMVLDLKKPTVLILTNGGALSTEGFHDAGGVKGSGASAIVEAFNPNVIGATALASLLFGKVNTWGKLPYSIYPSSYTKNIAMDDFDMTAGVGRTYRYYTGPVNFPFGMGLSYTTFDMECTLDAKAVACTVTNTGAFPLGGDEVVMMYSRPSAAVRAAADHKLPLKRLVDFERLRLGRGGNGVVTFKYDASTFASSTSNGDATVYSGVHQLVLSRGVGEELVFNVTLP